MYSPCQLHLKFLERVLVDLPVPHDQAEFVGRIGDQIEVFERILVHQVVLDPVLAHAVEDVDIGEQRLGASCAVLALNVANMARAARGDRIAEPKGFLLAVQ